MQTLTFKAPDEMVVKLDKFAALDERPKSYLIRKAVEAYLQELEEDEHDYKAAMEVLNDPNYETVPWENVKAKLGLDN